ncbi:hypothetical protein AAKU64_004644, partial [Undibacterium sp. GrIS 1.8]|uniref:hypothetical protein n=1 Tax=Undibacterium sp. GrIS 1.8 TaxID=3143934 RepID=UPI00339A9998
GGIVESTASGLDASAEFATSGKLPNMVALASAYAQRMVMSKIDKITKLIPGVKGEINAVKAETNAAKAELNAEKNAVKSELAEGKKEAKKEAKKSDKKNDASPPGDGVKVIKQQAGPCDHLRQGSGKGPYRGGAHSKTSKPVNDGKDSHHMPAKDVSPLNPKDGPAIQMDPKDHGKTSSNGQMPGSVDYREAIGNLISAGKWRDAMATEIRDVRRVAKEINDPKKYNEAMSEMLEFYKCLEKNNLLK